MPSGRITVKRLSGREADAAEWRAVYELCCRTGDNGQPIASDRWPIFAKLWVEPYEKIFPHWTYVAQVRGIVIGYLTGCPDSRAFNKARFWRSALPLFIDVVRGRYPGSRDGRRFVKQFFGLEKAAEQAFPRELRRMLQRDYPAHLHMNVDAAWRGSGVGRKLVEAFFSDLRNAGVLGVHLYCGGDPLEFYLHRGFKELGRVSFHGMVVYVLGRGWQNRASLKIA
jgi:GNAT superfamily N-acetyltransferase